MVRTQYVDTELLEAYIEKSGLRIDYIIDKLGISYEAFKRKRKGLMSFRGSEVYVMCDLLKIPEDDSKKIFCF